MAAKRSRPRIAIDVVVEAGEWGAPAALQARVEEAVAACLATAELPIVDGAELSMVFTDDPHIRALNRLYRMKDVPTNVLSFPASPPIAGRYGPLLGDVLVARDTVAREADEQGLTFEAHLTHLIVHGFLHLVGHDHVADDEAAVMESLETRILATLGVADPYAEGSA
jgi:probable rRNA maturation factor